MYTILRGMAFSLIELMVVIAIVAVLAAVATPAYINYVTKAKITSALQAISVYDGLAVEYYTRTGTFPTEEQIGWDPLNMPSQYITGMDAGPWNANAPTDCKAGNLYIYITNYDGGNFFEDNVGKGIIMNRYFIDLDGVITPNCFYYEVDANGQVLRDVVSGCAVQTSNTMDELTTTIETGCL